MDTHGSGRRGIGQRLDRLDAMRALISALKKSVGVGGKMPEPSLSYW